MNAEALTVPITPFEIIEQAPEEISLDGVAFRHGAMDVGDMISEVHHSICIFDFAGGVGHVVRSAAVFSDEDRLWAPEVVYVADAPVSALRDDVDPGCNHVRVGAW